MGDKAVGRGQKSQKMDGVIYGWPQRLKSVVDILEFEKGNVWKREQLLYVCIIKEARCKKSKSQFQCESPNYILTW